MNNQQSMEERIWEYIDGQVPSNDKSVIEQLIRDDQSWKAKYQELLELHQLINATELDRPSMRFTRNVMEEIARLQIAPATKKYINSKIIWGLGFFFITLFVGFLAYGLGQMDWSTTEGRSFTDNLGKIEISKFFNNNWVNVFMMINVVLGLVLLDNFLSNKRKQYHGEV